MSEPTYNVDLLMQVREKIVNEPEKHYQGLWEKADSDPREGGACRTAYCVAGWAAVLDGQELNWIDYEGDGCWEATTTTSGRAIADHARNALGLTRGESGNLFAGANSRPTVLRMLDLLIEAGKNGERASFPDFMACLRS